VRRSINAFICVLNFGVAHSQSANTEHFLRSSTYTLRMAYTIAVTFRSLVVELRDLYPIRGHTSSIIYREELIMRWKFLMQGNGSLKNLRYDFLASIDVPKYNKLCAGVEDRSYEASASKLDDEDRNYV
jgi:hypothetical protein